MGILSTIKEKLFGTSTKTTAAKTAATSAATSAATAASTQSVDVEAVIERLAKENGYKGNWRVSIVDFMKSLGLDSSLAARKELAKELNYTGSDPDGSAEKNTWLLKTLMKKLAESGGVVPKNLIK